MSFDIGVQSAVYIDGYDVTALLNDAKITSSQQALDRTTFRPMGRAKSFLTGLETDTVQLGGYSPLDYATAAIIMESAIKGGRQIAVGVGGFDVGNLALLIRGLKSNTDLKVMSDGIISASASYQGTAASPAIAAGVTIYTSHGSSVLGQDEVQVITFTNVPASLPLVVQKTGGGAVSAVFYPSSNSATMAAAITGLYGGTPSVALSLTTSTDGSSGETLYSGTASVDFGGTLADSNVPQMVILAGEQQQLNLASVTANGTPNGATIHPGDSAATIQAALQATGGNWANVVVQGQMS